MGKIDVTPFHAAYLTGLYSVLFTLLLIASQI